MNRTHLFFKVEIEHDQQDQAERLGNEICRQLMKIDGVRSAELSSFKPAEE
jgi:hypothetical protein